MKLRRLNLVSVVLALAATAPAAAAPGDLDPAFGTGGKLTTSFAPAAATASDVAVYPDGRIVVAGTATTGTETAFALARYLRDGTPDLTFSGDGRLTTAFPGGVGASATSVALQRDGKIVVAGYAGQFAVARYTSDGTLDSAFSGDGLQTVEFGGGSSGASALAVDARGRVVLAGRTAVPDAINSNDVAVARLTSAGELDPTFSSDGIYTEDLTYDGGDSLSAIAPLPDGGFTAVGTAFWIGIEGPELVTRRFASNGDLVSGFLADRNGRAVRSGSDIDLTTAGQAVIVGHSDGPASVGVLRLRPEGSYDPSFSGDGEDSAQIVAGVDASEYGAGVAVQPTGRIVVGVGVSDANGTVPPGTAFGLVRFLPGGGLDSSFAGDGRQATRFASGDSVLTSVALQGSRIVAAGQVRSVSGWDFGLAAYDGRFLPSPPPAGQPPVSRPPSARNRGPDSSIRRPGRPRARRKLTFRGRATDDVRVARVDLALLRVRSPRRGRRACQWLRTRRSGFTSHRVRRSVRCVRFRRFVRTDGTRRWHLRLRRGLPAGRYVLYSRATDDRGARERRFSSRDRNLVRFTVRRASAPSPRPSGG